MPLVHPESTADWPDFPVGDPRWQNPLLGRADIRQMRMMLDALRGRSGEWVSERDWMIPGPLGPQAARHEIGVRWGVQTEARLIDGDRMARLA